jgi:type IV pilus assembly protein PilB
MTSRIGDLLVRQNLLTAEQLAQANEAHKANGGFIGTHIVKLGFMTEQVLVQTIGKQYGVPIVELQEFTIPDQVLQLVPHNLAIKHGLLPLVQKESTLTVAMIDPTNMVALNDIKFITGLDIQVVIVSESALKQSHDKFFENNTSYDSIINDLDSEDIEVVESNENIDINELERATEDAPVVKLVNAILTDAIKKGASDIHVEPYEKTFRVRFRIDGVMYEIMKPPPKLKNAITSRLKIMAELDIAERRLPQDGRIKLKLGNSREMDFRVNVLPTLFRREDRHASARQVESAARHDEARLRARAARRL